MKLFEWLWFQSGFIFIVLLVLGGLAMIALHGLFEKITGKSVPRLAQAVLLWLAAYVTFRYLLLPPIPWMLFGFPVPAQGAPAYVVYIAGPIEFIGGLLVMIGLFTHWAAFLCSGLMAAAYGMVHGTQGLFPNAAARTFTPPSSWRFLSSPAFGDGQEIRQDKM